VVPHANVVVDAVRAARAAGFHPDVHTIAKAVGSDITNVVQNCLREGRFGAAAYLLTTFLAHDEVVAVSEYTRDEITWPPRPSTGTAAPASHRSARAG
jgi:glycogen(starch) synthase